MTKLDVTLGELFARCSDGMMVVAEDSVTGALVAVSAVPSGAACGCRCPVCGKSMVARKGLVRQHSFAHQADDHGASCTYGAETVLHRLAKDMVAAARNLQLPDIGVEDELGPLVVSQAKRVDFDEVSLEKRSHHVIPDVVGTSRSHTLHIEFKVTHAVTAAKMEKLGEADVSVIEIDLSDRHEVMLHDLASHILYDAPRKMLKSPHHAKGEALLARRIAATAVEVVAASSVHVPLRSRESKFTDRLSRPLFSPYLDEVFRDLRMFELSPTEWQSWIVWTLLQRPGEPVSMPYICGMFRSNGWVAAHEPKLTPKVVAYARDVLGRSIHTLEEAVTLFLDHLVFLGFVKQEGDKWLSRTGLAEYEKSTHIKGARWLKDVQFLMDSAKFDTGKRDIRKSFDRVLTAQGQPPGAVDFDRWLTDTSRTLGLQPFVLVTQTPFPAELAELAARLNNGGRIGRWPTFGLVRDGRRSG